MALSREKKTELVESYGEKVARAQVMIWAQNGGLSVAESSDLRGRVREAGGEVVVVKNTLFQRVLEEANLSPDASLVEGPNMVAFVYDDIAPVAKAVVNFVVEHQRVIDLKGGIVNGTTISVDQVRALTDLPSREILLARVVGGMQAPITGFVGVLAGVIRSFANVLNARQRQLEEPEA